MGVRKWREPAEQEDLIPAPGHLVVTTFRALITSDMLFAAESEVNLFVARAQQDEMIVCLTRNKLQRPAGSACLGSNSFVESRSDGSAHAHVVVCR